MTAWLLLGLLGVLLAALLLRQPLFVILLAVTAYLHATIGRGHFEDLLEDMWIAIDKELILSIPTYVLCGEVMSRGSSSRRLIRIMTALTRSLPGGLAVACILSCALFASISGSSIVTMLAIGAVMYPAMRAAHYDNRFTLGALMAGGTLGIIIPPSIPMLIYGLVTQTSVTDLFLAGIGPGLLLALVLAGYAAWANRHMPTERFDAGDLVAALKDGVWAALMPVVLLGGIYTGWFNTIEAAAVALGYAVLVEVAIHRELRPGDLYKLLLDSVRLAGTLLPVVSVALSMGFLFIHFHLAAGLVDSVRGFIDSPLMFLVVVNLLLLVAGCLMTTIEAIVVLGPLLAPVAEAYGIDKVLFGLIMILNLEIGYLTPPVGMNLIVAISAFKQPFGLLCRAAVPFIVLMLGCLVLVMWQPWIAMGLVS